MYTGMVFMINLKTQTVPLYKENLIHLRKQSFHFGGIKQDVIYSHFCDAMVSDHILQSDSIRITLEQKEVFSINRLCVMYVYVHDVII